MSHSGLSTDVVARRFEVRMRDLSFFNGSLSGQLVTVPAALRVRPK
jgi:hypothetical protein